MSSSTANDDGSEYEEWQMKITIHFFHFANAFTATLCSHVTGQSSAEWSRSRSPSNLVSGQDSTMWLVVCTLPHWHLSDDAMCHWLRLAAHRPCPVRKRFNIDHVERPSLKRGSRIVGSEMRFLLATETDLTFISTLGWSVSWRQVRRNRLSGS